MNWVALTASTLRTSIFTAFTSFRRFPINLLHRPTETA